ncbi:MAG: 4-alpha-glucanotransferase [Methylotenera sp.]|uniref:4-alpha-glucanotransferase n=1 Tax=Methylotenera sp. TaxID=2051956 RepID=UPI00181799EB|nr:4-alpha-glucanotransferase [Methylotenera sp.]NOU25968.1 4-alpha-glucanotransferase [Methylotenera sp.]
MKRTNLSLLAQRRAGVLLHISSLPSAYYVGDLGVEAFRFVDFLNSIGATVWQTLPINMPHADNSPYQCLSAFAGNPDFISLENLQTQGLLSKLDLSGLISTKTLLLEKAYLAFIAQAETSQVSSIRAQQAFKRFCKRQAHWLNDFALFLALRNKFNQAGWNFWPDSYKNRDAKVLRQIRKELAHEIAVIQFTQYVFFSQWLALKAYAASKNVYLFGDIPIFVAYDSADVWAQPHLFKLDVDKNMAVVAGVPPDYFSVTGQRWGNPHYNWQAMAQDGYSWWVSRMATQNALFDIVRIDHFRGLEAAWEIPASEDTAINGQWVLAPGDALLAAIKTALPKICLVAEDLGIITAEVDALREKYNLPGMKILQFAFSGNDDNPYLPANIEENSVVYTGTHDNDTTVGWYVTLNAEQTQQLERCIHGTDSEPSQLNIPEDLIQLALESNAILAILPMQDLLALDTNHRMNTPGTCSGNWHWRFNWHQLAESPAEKISEVIIRTGRS